MLNEVLVFSLQAISAGILVLGTLYSTYAISFKILKKESIPLHWCSTVVLGLWFSAFGFNILIYICWFNIQTALFFVSSLFILSYKWTKISFPLFIRLLKEDLRWLKVFFRLRTITPLNIFYSLFIICLVITTLRMILLVPLGWDFITYHGPKAAFWVKQGEYSLMHAPGGWSYYRNFFGGGELYLAWAMLPFRSDLVVCFVDATQWLFLGLGVLTLGREVGIRGKYSLMPVFYVLFIPAIWLSVGSGYVELGLNLALLYGGLFLLKFFRSKKYSYLCLSGISFGLAASTKIPVFPIFLLFVLLSLVFIFIQDKKVISFLIWFCAISAAMVVFAPWIVRNIIELGYPLDMPFTIAGIKLGQINKALEWYQIRPGLQPYNFSQEFYALSKIFPFPNYVHPHLSIFTLVPTLASIFGLFLLYKKDKYSCIYFSGVFILVVLSFYFPNFSVVRIMWASVSGRFLLPMIIPSVILGSAYFSGYKKYQHIYYSLMIVILLFHSYYNIFYGWARWEYAAVTFAFASVLIGILLLRQLYHNRKLVFLAAVIYPILWLFTLQSYKNIVRYKVVSECTVLHYFPYYWHPASKIVDTDKSLNIAVTGAFFHNGDNWFIYYFFGSRLQNNLMYIPISGSFDKHFELIDPRNITGTYHEWNLNLLKYKIDYIIDFGGGSRELTWIEQRPEIFERLYPETANQFAWGLYKYKNKEW